MKIRKSQLKMHSMCFHKTDLEWNIWMVIAGPTLVQLLEYQLFVLLTEGFSEHDETVGPAQGGQLGGLNTWYTSVQSLHQHSFIVLSISDSLLT